MNNIKLSIRLENIISMVDRSHKVIDIGTDHALVPIELIRRDISDHVIASDIHDKPLLIARDNISYHGYSKYIEVVQSDGLISVDTTNTDIAIMAGMGGNTIIEILEKAKDRLSDISKFILAPQSEISSVRRYLRDIYMDIIDEKMIKEDSKFYIIIKAIYDNNVSDDDRNIDISNYHNGEFDIKDTKEDLFGDILIKRKDHILMDYLKNIISRYEKILSNNIDDKRANEIKIYIEKAKETLYEMQ